MSRQNRKIDPNETIRIEPLVKGGEEIRKRHENNRDSWNQGAAYYTKKMEETLAFLKAGKSSLHPIERADLGDLREWCSTAIHLQCASGKDTLSLWNEGAQRVVGVDISDVHIANARKLSEALGAPATWYRCDILETPHELDGTADLIYTGQGALNWLHDLEGWAAVVFRLLKPGGILHVFDGHPVPWLFDDQAETYIASNNNYFTHCESSQGWSDAYIGDLGIPVDQLPRQYECLWPVSTVFQALRHAGLTVEHFAEHPEDYWESMPHLRAELRGRIPMTFSMIARRSG